MATFLVDMLTTFMQLICATFFMWKLIKAKRFLPFAVTYIGTTMLIYTLTGYLPGVPSYIRVTLSFASMFVILFHFRQIPRLPVAIYILLALCCMFLIELPSIIMARMINPDFTSVQDITPSQLFVWRTMYLPWFIFSYGFPYWLCSRIFKFENHKDISRYLPFILVQALMLVVPICLANRHTTDRFSAIIATVYLFANIILDLLLVRTFNSINRTHELERQQEQAQSILKAQLDYYNQLQENIQSLRQVRHDMKNQLQTLSILLEDREYDTAQKQLSAYREQLKKTETNRFTGNTVLDAVISAKADLCHQKDIPLSCSGSVPNDIAVDAVHLCSIAANLLDNSIHACDALPPEIMPSIQFSAQWKADKLLFLCKNPAVPGRELRLSAPKLNQEHGWGLSILSRIAQDYGGEMLLEERDGFVQASLWLNFQPTE